jgi:hypothetical protein
VKHLYYWLKTVDQFAISITICLKLVCFVLKEVENAVSGVTNSEGLDEGICGKVYTCLFSIVR